MTSSLLEGRPNKYKNDFNYRNVQSYRHVHLHRSASRSIPIAKVKTITRMFGLGFDFDLLTSGSVQAEVLPYVLCCC